MSEQVEQEEWPDDARRVEQQKKWLEEDRKACRIEDKEYKEFKKHIKNSPLALVSCIPTKLIFSFTDAVAGYNSDLNAIMIFPRLYMSRFSTLTNKHYLTKQKKHDLLIACLIGTLIHENLHKTITPILSDILFDKDDVMLDFYKNPGYYNNEGHEEAVKELTIDVFCAENVYGILLEGTK